MLNGQAFAHRHNTINVVDGQCRGECTVSTWKDGILEFYHAAFKTRDLQVYIFDAQCFNEPIGSNIFGLKIICVELWNAVLYVVLFYCIYYNI